MRLTKSMQIDAPTAEVFDFMADCNNEAGWNPDVKAIRRLDSGPLGPGAVWEGDYRGMGTMRIVLEEYDRPTRLSFSTTGKQMDMRFTFAYGPATERADISLDMDVQPKGLMKAMTPLLGPMMNRTFAKRPAQLAEGVRRARAERSS
jgi:hypothetical protein